MKYYLEDGSEFTYNGDLTNRVGKGKEGAIYYLNANECVKMYYIDSMLKIEKEIFDLLKSLNLDNFCKLGNMIYNENGELSGYTMNYYNTITKNVLFMPKEYFLDNFNALYNSFKTLSDNRIIANDIWLKNCLIGSNITMIDFDRYIKSSLSIKEIREINIARLMELFKKIYLYYVSSVMGKVPAHIWNMTDDIFSYSNNPVKRLSKVFEGYKKPIDLITKK